MKEKEFIQWTKFRKRGFFVFVILGTLFFVLATFILDAIITLFAHKYLTDNFSRVIQHLITGILIAIAIWFYSENRYKKYLSNQTDGKD
ncbi:hypothetical protein EHS13_13675 [Paenibacillus psychroresistens]|uniref:Uncharacterized protein n=1 Tax=Paenibacillus psychroresistens TaxID=1778678 RepID=A0A6B8RJT7_9BACL|nr:hypothetical protein [Paenibacillus psychroresistens]QGQ95852.1 hypothetical protein EHS13_13675 [Paenibacillus psychroresistens]